MFSACMYIGTWGVRVWVLCSWLCSWRELGEGVNKENEEVLSIDMSHSSRFRTSQESASNLETTVRDYCASLLYYFGYWGPQPIFP